VGDEAIEEVTIPAPPAPQGADGSRAPTELLATLELAAGAPLAAGRTVRLAAFTMAVAAHAAMLYVLAREPEDAMVGGQGRVLDAISVTIVDSAVLESLDRNRLLTVAPAGAGAVAANDGASDAAATEKKREQRTEDVKETQQNEERKQKKPLVEPVRAEAILKAVPPLKEPPPEPNTMRETDGGAVAQGDAPAIAVPRGAAAASPGAVREYGNHVRQALGKTRPKKGLAHERGTVKSNS
jgi:hypothetical protein